MSTDSVLDLLQSLAIVILMWRTTRGRRHEPPSLHRQAEAPHRHRDDGG